MSFSDQTSGNPGGGPPIPAQRTGSATVYRTSCHVSLLVGRSGSVSDFQRVNEARRQRFSRGRDHGHHGLYLTAEIATAIPAN